MFATTQTGERVILLAVPLKDHSPADGLRLLQDMQRGSPASEKVPATWSVHPTDTSGTAALCRTSLNGNTSPVTPRDWERVLADLIANGLVPATTTRLGRREPRKLAVKSANYDSPAECVVISDLEDEGRKGEVKADAPLMASDVGSLGFWQCE